ncbi:hypothetical protein [Azospirillum aestuarii]|uniref:hypothetical protein n=1 Tax=Azospirillum aestuarii TaxID=2802052 RepID=UPI004054B6CF
MTEQKGIIPGSRLLPFYTIRLRDLMRPVAVLTVVCEACRHRLAVDPFAFAAAKGPDATLRQLERVLRCGHCGMKGWVRFELDWTEPP